MNSVIIIFYADYGVKYGKGNRMANIVSYLDSINFSYSIICRINYSKNNNNNKILDLGLLGYFLRLLALLLRYFGFNKYLSRYLQERFFDLIVRFRYYSKLKSATIFSVPGLHCTLNYSKNNYSKLYTLVFFSADNQSEFKNFYFLNYLKSFKYSDGLIFPSKSVYNSFDKPLLYLNKCFVLSNWLSKFDCNKVTRINFRQPVFGFLGGNSIVKGFRLVFDFFNSTKQFQLNVYDYSKVLISNSNISFFKHSSLNDICKDNDIILVPSYCDAEPRVIREFLNEGKIVVARENITSIVAESLILFKNDENFISAIFLAVDLFNSFEFSKQSDHIDNLDIELSELIVNLSS